MKVTMTGRKCTLRPSFVERTESKLSKLDKFFDTDATADVTVSNERNRQRVEITIRYNGMVFRAEDAAEDTNEAVDRLTDVLLRQIRRNKTRLEKRLRSHAFDDLLPEPDWAEEEYNVVKSKSFPVKPMDVQEAILQMNLTGHQFYMFRNGDTGEINVVYHRRDGDYGLLEPDTDE